MTVRREIQWTHPTTGVVVILQGDVDVPKGAVQLLDAWCEESGRGAWECLAEIEEHYWREVSLAFLYPEIDDDVLCPSPEEE